MTVKDYLMTLPEPHRSRALKYENFVFGFHVNSFHQAVNSFKYWESTIEGFDYWEAIANKDYSKALEICPITEDERHLIDNNSVNIVDSEEVFVKNKTVGQIKSELNKPAQEAIDWLYLQYEIYGYLTPDMVKKAKEKLAQ